MGEQKKIYYKDIRFVVVGPDWTGIVSQGKTGAVWHTFDTRRKKEEQAFLEAFPPIKEHGGFVFHAPPPWHSVDITAGLTVAGYGRAGAIFFFSFNQHFEERSKVWRKNPDAEFPALDWRELINVILKLMAENNEV